MKNKRRSHIFSQSLFFQIIRLGFCKDFMIKITMYKIFYSVPFINQNMLRNILVNRETFSKKSYVSEDVKSTLIIAMVILYLSHQFNVPDN